MNRAKVTSADVRALTALVSEGNCLAGAAVSED